MLITKNKINDQNQGYLELISQSTNDLQVLDQIIKIGNSVGTVTTRKILMGTKMDRKVVKVVIKVVKIIFSRQDQEISVQGNVILTSNPDIPLGSSHSFKITQQMKFTLSKYWSKDDLDLINQPTDVVQQCIIAISPGIARIHLYGEILEYIARVEVTIPGKNRFNADKINKGIQKFIDEVFQTIKNKVQVKTLIFCGNSDIVHNIEKQWTIKEFEVIFAPTKAFTIRSCILELIQMKILQSTIWGKANQILEETTIRITNGGFLVYSQDVITAIEQYPTAFENVLVLKSILDSDLKYQTIFKCINQEILIKVPDYADPAEKLKQFGGMVGLLKYEIFIEKIIKVGEIFTNFDEFSESDDQ